MLFSFLGKTTPAKPDFKFSEFSSEEILKLKSDLSVEINLFNDIKGDFQTLLIADDIDLFVRGGPIEDIDSQMRKSLLPEKKNVYINIMGSIRFIRLHDKKGTKDIEKVGIELFEKVIQGDSDIISDIIFTIENSPVSMALKTPNDISDVAFNTKRVALKIGDGIFTGDDDIEISKQQIQATNDMKSASERVIAFFKILRALASLDMSKKQ